MHGRMDWKKRKLAVTTKVFKVVPKVTVIEFSKFVGDTSEYKEFCEEYVRLVLKDIIYNDGCSLRVVNGPTRPIFTWPMGTMN